MTATPTAPPAVPILMYHAIAECPGRSAYRLSVAPEAFAEQMDLLAGSGFSPLTAQELSAAWRYGAVLPPRPVLITFDDGYEGVHRHALPVLSRHGFPATVFVTTGWLRGGETAESAPCTMLDWHQVHELSDAGVEIGAHTHCHPQLDQLVDDRLWFELLHCRQLLGEELGRRPVSFAYPYGYSSARVRRAVGDAGFAIGLSVGNAMARPTQGAYALRRLTVRRSTGIEEFERLVEDRWIGPNFVVDRLLTQGFAVGRISQRAARRAWDPVPDATSPQAPTPILELPVTGAWAPLSSSPPAASPTAAPSAAPDAPDAPAPPAPPPPPTGGSTGKTRGGGTGTPLFRNAYALMLNTGLSGVLGIAFWVLAARYYSDAAVGAGSALIAAMKFLAGLTALTLPGALQRFIPVAGKRTRKLVLGTYLVSAIIVAAAAGVFVITLGLWGPTYRLVDGGLPALAFLASVILWALLTLQDGVLTGLRSAVWVPVGNTVFLIAKMVLVVALASVFPAAGVFVSWAAAIALSVVPLAWLVFQRLIPRHVNATRKAELPAPRQIWRFLAGDCTGSLFSLAVIYLLPVVVATQISPELNAYFYLAAVIGSSIDLLAINMGASLTVEGAHAPSRLAALCRASLRRMALIMIPISLLTVLFAPQILQVFGAEYAANATMLLRLMAVATLTRVLFEVYFAVLRVQNRTFLVALLQGSLCVLLIGSTVVLLGPFGITGAGYAQLASQSLIAVVACFGLARLLRPRPPSALAVAAFAPAAAPATAPTPVSLSKAVRPPGRASGARAVADRARRLRLPWPVIGGWAMLGAALALYWLPLRGMTDASLDAMNGLGLVSVLPLTTLLGAALLVVAFCWGLWLRTQRRGLLIAVLLATVVSLHAVPAVIEAYPRFSTAWEHAGFVEYFQRTGDVAPAMDGRFTWPGFFIGVALLTKAGGISDLTQLMQWWPVAINLLYLVPMFLLLRAVRATWRAKWCAAWVFVLCGWVGQDYFSPQSAGFLAYLLLVAVLLVWFRSSPPDARRKGARVPGEARPRPTRRSRQALLLALLIGLFTITTVSHPLTPFIMLATVTGLVLWKRSSLRGLPLLCAVIVATWTGFFVETYWAGHSLFSSFGSLGGNITSSTSGRIEGGDTLHSMVLYCRVILAASVMALAVYGWLRRRERGISDRALVILFLMPFMGVWLQSYGGEIALRVFMFMLPAAAILAGLAFFPRLSYRRRPWLGPLAALMAGLVLMGGFLVARWGNESYERVRPGEVAAMEYLTRHDSPTARALWLDTDPPSVLSPNLPWRVTKDMERTVYKPVVSPRDPEKAGPLVRGLEDAGPNSYLVLTRGSAKYLQLTADYPENWYDRAIAALDQRPDVTKVVAKPDAAVYRLAEPYTEPADQPLVGNTGLNVTWTAWSVLGGVAAALLLVLLSTREFIRVLVPDRRRLRAMRVSLLVALPLVGLLAVSIVIRFLTLS